jgi:hypothetical protein
MQITKNFEKKTQLPWDRRFYFTGWHEVLTLVGPGGDIGFPVS